MLCGTAFKYTTAQDYTVPYSIMCLGSSMQEELNIDEAENYYFLGLLNHGSIKSHFACRWAAIFQIDSSSVHPNPTIESSNETALIEEIGSVPEDIDLEYDVFFRMPPVKREKVKLRVKSVKNAIPRFVEP